MSDIIWWVGAVHIAIYAAAGTVVVGTLAFVKAHVMAKVMGRVIAWHIARARWSDRKDRGWVEPAPSPYADVVTLAKDPTP